MQREPRTPRHDSGCGDRGPRLAGVCAEPEAQTLAEGAVSAISAKRTRLQYGERAGRRSRPCGPLGARGHGYRPRTPAGSGSFGWMKIPSAVPTTMTSIMISDFVSPSGSTVSAAPSPDEAA